MRKIVRNNFQKRKKNTVNQKTRQIKATILKDMI